MCMVLAGREQQQMMSSKELTAGARAHTMMHRPVLARAVPRDPIATRIGDLVKKMHDRRGPVEAARSKRVSELTEVLRKVVEEELTWVTHGHVLDPPSPSPSVVQTLTSLPPAA